MIPASYDPRVRWAGRGDMREGFMTILGARGPWIGALVLGTILAGSLMGGDIEDAVREVRERGLLVISLNMAGSVPAAADLVITDPVQAGVMAVMAVADTAKFNVHRLSRRVF